MLLLHQGWDHPSGRKYSANPFLENQLCRVDKRSASTMKVVDASLRSLSTLLRKWLFLWVMGRPNRYVRVCSRH